MKITTIIITYFLIAFGTIHASNYVGDNFPNNYNSDWKRYSHLITTDKYYLDAVEEIGTKDDLLLIKTIEDKDSYLWSLII
jgi:hypothetical protein